MTTSIVVESDGTIRHVPTKLVVIDGTYYASINSLTNSTYVVIWHSVEFKDVTDHWAKAAINDMGSRMIVSGTGHDMYRPNRPVTRAEFAAIIVRGLGLKLDDDQHVFTDVKQHDWYNRSIQTAYKYGFVNGFEDGSFRPNDSITREQAMLMVSKAMKLTQLQGMGGNQDALKLLSNQFSDAKLISSWALHGVANSVTTGIITGRDNDKLAPQDFITRAEVAVVIQRLLQHSGLIE